MSQRRWFRHIGPVALLAMAAAWAASAGGCSALNTTAVQCLSEAECLAKGPEFANTTCDPTSKTCVPVEMGTDTCAATSDCVKSKGTNYICRKSDSKCVSLLSPECPFLVDPLGSYQNDNVVILGALTPANDNALGAMMEKSVELAQSDFKVQSNWLPPVTGSTNPRPVIVVACNEFGGGNDGLIRAGNHLIKDLQVPILLGPVDSGNDATVEVAVTLPNKTLSILPTSTLSGLSQLSQTNGTLLTWRLNYSDSTLASTVGDLFKTVLPARAQALGIVKAGDPLKVMIIEENNLFGLTIGGKMQSQIVFNGKSAADNATDGNYQLGNIGDQRDTINNPTPAATVATVVAAALQFQPNIILHASAVVGVTAVLIPLEAQWPAGVPRPIHVGANPSWASDPLTQWIGGQASRAQRILIIRGRTPPADSSTAQNQLQWNARFLNFDHDVPPGTPLNPLLYLWYDATYLGIYSAAAVGANHPLTGINAASLGMQTKVSVAGAMEIAPTPDQIPIAIQALSMGNPIKYTGLSGALNIDTTTGAPLADTEAACPDLKGGYVPSGYAYLSTTTQAGSGNIGAYACDTSKTPPTCGGCQ